MCLKKFSSKFWIFLYTVIEIFDGIILGKKFFAYLGTRYKITENNLMNNEIFLRNAWTKFLELPPFRSFHTHESKHSEI